MNWMPTVMSPWSLKMGFISIWPHDLVATTSGKGKEQLIQSAFYAMILRIWT